MKKIHILLATTALALSGHVAAQVTLYQSDNFQGPSFVARKSVSDLARTGFNDVASSAVVAGERWQVCQESKLAGSCTVLRAGRYPSLTAMGLDGGIASVRPLTAAERVSDRAYAPAPVGPVVATKYSRRNGEKTFQATVTSAHAVVGTPGQHCWIEREQVQAPAPEKSAVNVPGALVGALIGGVLGHQVGGGNGKTIATVGAAAGGAYIGSQYGRKDVVPVAAAPKDVQRCDSNPVKATPSYWDVTYDFRGQEHRVQTAAQPGPTITVNRNGEPRV
jgi:uncharacterized protein YcfJ